MGITCFWAQNAKMSLTAISSLESARRKFFKNSTYVMSTKVGITCFWAQDAKMSLTAISTLEIGEKKIFHERDAEHVSCLQTWNQTCFWAQDTKMSLTAISSLESAIRKFFINSTYIISTIVGITCFRAKDSKISLTAISSKKIFHELDEHHVYKVGITCFWAQHAKMSLTSYEHRIQSASRKFFMNSTYIMSTT